MADNPQDSLLFMLGEMRTDLKYLVSERSKTSKRIDALEAEHNARLSTLEQFKTKIGMLTMALGASAPFAATALLKYMGLT